MTEVREVELKLELNPADIDVLLAHLSTTGTATDRIEADSVYFDTARRKLRAAGISLRVRHIGTRRLQTIKMDKGASAGLFVRGEWEQEIEGDLPVPGAAEGPLTAALDASIFPKLKPVFRTVVERRMQLLRSDEAAIELVFDRGEIVAEDRSLPVCEVELELKEGAPAALFALARQLDAVAPVRLGVLTKSERGYRLEAGTQRPAKAEPIALSADMTAATAFQAIARSCIRQFRLNQDVLTETNDPAALHQARVGLRRLRTALSLFRPMLQDGAFEHLRTELRWIAAALGEARDLDVLMERSENMERREQLREKRLDAYEQVTAALSSARLRHLMLDLSEWIALGDWVSRPADPALRDRPFEDAAAEILRRRRKRLKRRGQGLAQLDDETRHEVRIDAKKLRYAAEFFAPLYSGTKASRRHKTFLGAVESIQQHLGDLNDQAAAPALLKQFGLPENAGDEADIDRADLLARAEEAYEALISAKRFWR